MSTQVELPPIKVRELPKLVITDKAHADKLLRKAMGYTLKGFKLLSQVVQWYIENEVEPPQGPEVKVFFKIGLAIVNGDLTPRAAYAAGDSIPLMNRFKGLPHDEQDRIASLPAKEMKEELGRHRKQANGDNYVPRPKPAEDTDDFLGITKRGDVLEVRFSNAVHPLTKTKFEAMIKAAMEFIS